MLSYVSINTIGNLKKKSIIVTPCKVSLRTAKQLIIYVYRLFNKLTLRVSRREHNKRMVQIYSAVLEPVQCKQTNNRIVSIHVHYVQVRPTLVA